ncbi:unnamed protein product [Porites evermanni]|uniref:Chromo domain-containing protein n=1 Tax=Porites evermanni TaxID=104178 RepID=A0ABN8LF95_9CNID|nr:unnamed protein product [Porites evermanni]
MSQKLIASYVDPSKPGSLRDVRTFANAQGISPIEAQKQLEQTLSYTLHKPRRRRFLTLPTMVYGINEQFMMDLVDLQKLAKWNKGYKYLLTVTDVLSKYAWVERLKLTYKLTEWNGTPLKGTFYEKDVQKVVVQDDALFRIDQVLKRKGNQVFVSWKGWPKEYNSWNWKKDMQDGYKTLPKQLGKEIKFIQGLRELKENMSDD